MPIADLCTTVPPPAASYATSPGVMVYEAPPSGDEEFFRQAERSAAVVHSRIDWQLTEAGRALREVSQGITAQRVEPLAAPLSGVLTRPHSQDTDDTQINAPRQFRQDETCHCGAVYAPDDTFCGNCGMVRPSVAEVPNSAQNEICRCGTRFTPDSDFCRMCGVRRATSSVERCKCGNKYAPDSIFCRMCGEKRPGAIEEVPATPQVPTMSVQPVRVGVLQPVSPQVVRSLPHSPQNPQSGKITRARGGSGFHQSVRSSCAAASGASSGTEAIGPHKGTPVRYASRCSPSYDTRLIQPTRRFVL